MQRLRTVTSLDVSAVAGHHAMPAALLLIVVRQEVSNFDSSVVVHELQLGINRALYVFMQFR